MRRPAAVLAGSATLALLGAFGATAGSGRDHEDAQALREQGAIVPLEDVLRAARAQRPGRVVEVKLKRKREAHLYEIEVLDDSGEVWELRYDARTGALLREEQEP